MTFTRPLRHPKIRIQAVILTLIGFVGLMALPAMASAAETYQLITKWGSLGSGNGQFDFPEAVTVDSAGNVFVADPNNNRVQKFSPDGTFMTKWGSEGTTNGKFNYPSAVAVDATGTVFVADTDNNRVQRFTNSGAFLGAWGGNGSGPGQLKAPSGIAINSAGDVFVVDKNNHRIQKFSNSGDYIGGWGSYGNAGGEFGYPDGIAIDSSGTIYVSDMYAVNPEAESPSYNYRIQKFDSSGSFLLQWGGQGIADGKFNSPEGVSVDTAGKVYVADANNHRIQKFDPDGTFVAKWGSFGASNGSFKYPRGIFVDPDGNVFVADSLNDRIQKFNLSHLVPPVTTLSSSPGSPDGSNGWFKMRPTVTLTRSEAGTTYFKWGSTGWATYTGPLVAPEGQHRLYYFSKDSDDNSEAVNNELFKTDSVSPSTAVVRAPRYSTNRMSNEYVRVSWGADDGSDSSGLYYDLYVKTGDRGSWKFWKRTASSAAFYPGRAGRTYYFRGRARDKAGHVGGMSEVVSSIVPHDQTSLLFGSGWGLARHKALFLQSANYTGGRGAVAQMSYGGAREIALIVTKAPYAGYADVYINGKRVKVVNLYSSRRRYRLPVLIAVYDTPQNGTIKVVARRVKTSASRGYRVELDGIAVKR